VLQSVSRAQSIKKTRKKEKKGRKKGRKEEGNYTVFGSK
jgi:hypothetical protein